MRRVSIRWVESSDLEQTTGEYRFPDWAKIPIHDPELAPRDEAVWLLHTAAEVEHALLVQYIYAAYSFARAPFSGNPPDNAEALVREWSTAILDIARQEMGHLITVQNLLLALSGPVTFEREDFPFFSEFYPFPFKLEPLTKESLAKYVAAEMPPVPEPDPQLREIILRAIGGNTGIPVNRVGALYYRLGEVIRELNDSDFRAESEPLQADPDQDQWELTPHMIVKKILNGQTALAAVQAIAEQGEGPLTPPANGEASHYQRFRDIYAAFPETDPVVGPVIWRATKLVPTNPTAREGTSGADLTPISCATTRLWAQLFNLRYRVLLAFLSHLLREPRGMDPSLTRRADLVSWAIDEMMNAIGAVGRKLTDLSLAGTGAARAGAPFELPYTLNLPEDEHGRWRLHLDLIDASATVIAEIGDTEPTLTGIVRMDGIRRPIIEGFLQAS
jgi:hypothetical protein